MERIEMTPTRLTSRALLLTGLAFLLTACSADVSGTVYVTSGSGDVRRGADVPVLLVREQFMGEWTEASVTFKASYRQAAVAYLEARTRLHRAHEDYVRSRTGYRVGDGRSYEEASERLREAASRVEAVKKEWSEHTASLARQATIRSSRTDVNGRYEFPGVRRGKYFVMANHKVSADELFWLVPIEVRRTQSVDLSSSNRSYPFDLIRGDADMVKAVAAAGELGLAARAPAPTEVADRRAREGAAGGRGASRSQRGPGSWSRPSSADARAPVRNSKIS
jgi:hypothetical protein